MDNNQDLLRTNELWKEHIERWKFLIRSYLGGHDFRKGEYLLAYIMEGRSEYEARLDSTPYDNHTKAIVAIYNAFLFRKPPKRSFGSLSNDPGLQDFLKDADLDGRDFNTVMRDISTYSSIYGHCWCIIDKPVSNAFTRAEELNQGIRPYVSIITPENVLDWNYSRAPNGMYVLDYLKVFEGRNAGKDTFRIYTPQQITVITQGDDQKSPEVEFVIPNALNRVPAVCVYSQRSPHRGIGISDVGDVADMCRAIYNELSESEQLLRLTNHPSLVKTASTQAAAGAGAIIQMPEDMTPDLKPYLLQPNGASIDGLLNSLKWKIESIDRMAHMGGIRSIETRRLSGVALATEFQLLNSRLADKAANLEVAEEQIWRLYAQWQGTTWDGEIDYPDSFNIQDKYNDMNMLKLAKDASPRSEVVNEEIEKQMLRILIEDDIKYEELVKEVDVEVVNGEVQAEMPSPPESTMAQPQGYQEQDTTEEYSSEGCPIATQDIAVNLENRQKAIDTAHYGPLNPNQPNRTFWMRLADKWTVSEEQAKQSRCGNCAAFNQTSKIKDCIDAGLSAGGATGNEWDTVNAGDLGYCEAFDFKCASSRVCDAWIVGGPIVD